MDRVIEVRQHGDHRIKQIVEGKVGPGGSREFPDRIRHEVQLHQKQAGRPGNNLSRQKQDYSFLHSVPGHQKDEDGEADQPGGSKNPSFQRHLLVIPPPAGMPCFLSVHYLVQVITGNL
ncbi:hypothetical protein D3C75_1057660 [compost metagenome]